MRWHQPTHRKRKIHQLTQQYDERQQKHGQREAENKNDALPRAAQNNFTPARVIGRVGWACFLGPLLPRVS
jgi:hypothetical protein